MLRRVAERVLGGHGGPTSDLYFVNACKNALVDGRVMRLSPTVFSSESAVLVMRHGAGLNLTKAIGGRRLVWLIDDDVVAGISDRALTPLHRLKLTLCERAFARTYRSLISTVVVSSPRLVSLAKALVPNADVAVLSPYWSEPFADLTHFDRTAKNPPRDIHIGFLGAGTHGADLAALWPVIGEVLDRVPCAHVWVPASHHPPGALSKNPRCHAITETTWANYRASMPERRFHILAYPLRDTPFNRARSVNKIIEHAILGGAGLYAASWPEALRITDQGAGLVLEDTPEAWRAALCDLIVDIAEGGSRTVELARAGQTLARQLNDPGPQRSLWARLLAFDPVPGSAV